ncbi:arylsulfatase [candidate division KSB1 bacterium]|nr:arylsulfatase [candidate division KSB1 bacterium]
MNTKNYSRRSFLQTFGAGTAALGLSCLYCNINPKSMPNIVFILADDMGYGDLTCLNKDSKIQTPNMDRIADEGVIFTDAHSGSAVCTPTRYGILTGRYCWRTSLKSGVLWGYSPCLIEPGRQTVASLLKQNGYSTACIGKWHLGLGSEEKTDYGKPLHPGPNDFGFDYFFGIPASLDMDPYLYVENDHAVEQPTGQTPGSTREQEGFWRAGPIAPGFKHVNVLPDLTKKAVEFVDKHVQERKNNPFFLYFALTAPHTPWVPDDSFRGKSSVGKYGDFVKQVDWTIGRVLETLERHDLLDNTLLIVTSDNGSDERFIDPDYDHQANYIFRGQKSDIWDGGHRIPFIARWPERIKSGTVCDELICLTDLYATAASIVGADLPVNAAEDSFNILPALEGRKQDKPIREAVVHHSIDGMFAIRKGGWKLILGRGSGGWTDSGKISDLPGQLYNITDDIVETRNLYNEKPDIVKQLTDLLEKYKQEGHSRQV